jgi:uncharacterized membrane protein
LGKNNEKTETYRRFNAMSAATDAIIIGNVAVCTAFIAIAMPKRLPTPPKNTFVMHETIANSSTYLHRKGINIFAATIVVIAPTTDPA